VIRERRILGYLLPLPALALLAVFVVTPLVTGIVLSFSSWQGAGPVPWVGFRNWSRLLHNPDTASAFERTLIAAFFSWVFQIVVGGAIGIYLAGRHRYRAVLAVVFFVPMVLSSTAVAIIWLNFLDPNFGAFQPALRFFHLHVTAAPLGTTSTALYAVTAVVCWQFIPFTSLLFLGGRRGIPESLYEAAALDGARGVQALWHITLPQLRYTIVTASILVLVGSLSYFDLYLVMTNGGPGNATTVLALRMYDQAFQASNIGAGSAIAVSIGLFGLLASLVMVKLSGYGRMESQQEGAA
jgi:raffinose/stachyose/melibiose transport system permease protein